MSDALPRAVPRISLVVNTRNEERELPGLLASAHGVDEIVVADMESTDATVEIARRAGATVLSLANAGYCEPGRQPALDAATGDWLLVLDADERLSPGGVVRLRDRAAQASADVAALTLVRHMFVGGVHVRRSGWEPEVERHPRFFRRGRVRWPARIHVLPEVDGAIAEVAADEAWIDHRNFADLEQFIAKVNRYSTIEARDLAGAGRAPSLLVGLDEGISELTRRYAPAEDGALSFGLSFGILAYRLLVQLKAAELMGWPPDAIPSRHAVTQAAAELGRALGADLLQARPGGAGGGPPPRAAPAAAPVAAEPVRATAAPIAAEGVPGSSRPDGDSPGGAPASPAAEPSRPAAIAPARPGRARRAVARGLRAAAARLDPSPGAGAAERQPPDSDEPRPT